MSQTAAGRVLIHPRFIPVSVKRVFSRYNALLKERPLITNMATSFCISSVGDCIAQIYQHQLKFSTLEQQRRDSDGKEFVEGSPPSFRDSARQIDPRRTVIMGSFSCFISAPFVLLLFRASDHVVGVERTIFNAIKKGLCVWCTSWMFSPLFFMYCTVMSNLFLKGNTTAHFGFLDHCNSVIAKLQKDFLFTAKCSISFWSLHWIPQFYLLPPHLRLVYGSSVHVVWASVMSYIQHRV